ncbi:MAG: ABC-F family ATP-binding cassette domain-containing protein [Acidimicrobiaceae bacterium]|nr:ABC-F family ATP-binding cassette domain-containing protein [Acidimicrobiaceae bacterium]
MATLLDLQHVQLHGSDRPLLSDASLTISSGERIGVVGANGVGKSSLLRVLAGLHEPDSGLVVLSRGLRRGYLAQEPELPEGLVGQVVGGTWESEAHLDRLGMSSLASHTTTVLSGGQRKRLALIELLTREQDLLVLDEPTNHLDLPAIDWLEEQIRRTRAAVVLVSHDRFLLDRICTTMVEIDAGDLYRHSGGYDSYLEGRALRDEQDERAERVRRNLARTELAWLRRGAKARTRKPQARIDAAERLIAAQRDVPDRDGRLDLVVDTPRLGDTVVKLHRVSLGYAEGPEIIHGVDLDLGPGDRVGIVGPNGVGKSTLLHLLAGQLTPRRGTLKVGPRVVTSLFEQNDTRLDPRRTVQELVAGPQGQPGSPADVALMRQFGFSGALTLAPSGHLSGGERRRLQLLLALSVRPNLLLLDEPTNDLDLETIRLLEDFIARWPGTLVVVSHDRAFLSRTTDRLFEVVTDGSVREFPGGIDGLMERGFTQVGDAAEDSVPRGRLQRDAEKEMGRLERRRRSLEERIGQSSDLDEQRRWHDELQTVVRELAEAEERWLSLFDYD